MDAAELKLLLPNVIPLNLSLKPDAVPTILHGSEEGNSYMLRMKDNKLRGVTVYWPNDPPEARRMRGYNLRDTLRQRIGNAQSFKSGRFKMGDSGVAAQNVEVYAIHAGGIDAKLLLTANSNEVSLTILDPAFLGIADFFRSYDDMMKEAEARRQEKQRRKEAPPLPPLVDYLDEAAPSPPPSSTATQTPPSIPTITIPKASQNQSPVPANQVTEPTHKPSTTWPWFAAGGAVLFLLGWLLRKLTHT